MIYTLIAILGIGGGFAVLGWDFYNRNRFERWMAALISSRSLEQLRLAEAMIATRYGCDCPRCQWRRITIVASDHNEAIERGRVAALAMIESTRKLIAEMNRS